jgi:hypothetical protein
MTRHLPEQRFLLADRNAIILLEVLTFAGLSRTNRVNGIVHQRETIPNAARPARIVI